MNSNLKAGFGKVDITPRIGVELCGFGPFITRHSIAVRDRLWARAMAVSFDNKTFVVVSCDLAGLSAGLSGKIRQQVCANTGLPPESVMTHCTHTHSGPNTGGYIGWGEPDMPYLEIVPQRIAEACCLAVRNLCPAEIYHAEVPCRGIGYNRENYGGSLKTNDVLKDGWQPENPELTDTTCQVLRVESAGRVLGFASYFGCHPVVCCADTRYIHGDYCGVATNLLEREHPGSVGLFLQGAQGDVNSCVVHKPEQESLLALDVIAGRYASAVRHGLQTAGHLEVDSMTFKVKHIRFSRKKWTLQEVTAKLNEQEQIINNADASDTNTNVRMAVVRAIALRGIKTKMEAGEDLEPETELHGFRLGRLLMLGGPFETFQAIKNEVKEHTAPCPTMLLGFTNDSQGYAPDKITATKGGYAADTVPLMLGALPYAAIHEELSREFRQLADELE